MGQKMNMTFLDFHNSQSGHIVAAELPSLCLIRKLSKNVCFHRNTFVLVQNADNVR